MLRTRLTDAARALCAREIELLEYGLRLSQENEGFVAKIFDEQNSAEEKCEIGCLG